jgi:predicted nucleotidyltransferase
MVFLIGSYAEGTVRTNSDLDIAVLLGASRCGVGYKRRAAIFGVYA